MGNEVLQPGTQLWLKSKKQNRLRNEKAHDKVEHKQSNYIIEDLDMDYTGHQKQKYNYLKLGDKL